MLSHLIYEGDENTVCFRGGHPECPYNNNGSPLHHFYGHPFTVKSSLSRGFLSLKWGGDVARVHLPDPATPEAMAMETRCTTLDILNKSFRDLHQLATLVQPKTLRLLSKSSPFGIYFSDTQEALATFQPTTAIIDLSHDRQEMTPWEKPLAVSDCTKRIVFHQVTRYSDTLVQLRGDVREVVLVFVNAHYHYNAHHRLPERFLDYIAKVVSQLPNAAITIVNIEAVNPPVDVSALTARFQDANLEVRTLDEHRRALPKWQWEIEMELQWLQ
jgi:hypothetical protein